MNNPVKSIKKEVFKLVEQLPESCMLFDKNHKLVAINQAALNLYDCTREDVMHQHLSRIGYENQMPRRLSAFKSIDRGISDVSYVESLVLDNGRTIYYHIKVFKIDEYYGVLNHDITPLSTMKDKLEQTVLQLHEAQKIAQIGSWDWNVETNELIWTDELYRIFGLDYYKEDVNYDLWLSKIHKDDQKMALEVVQKCMETGEPYAFDHRIIKDENTVSWLHAVGSATKDASGKIIRLSGTAQNIDAQKNFERKQIEYINSLEEMMFITSHKIRRPVANLLGFTRDLNDRKDVLEDVVKHLKYINESANELDQYTEEMTEFIHNNKLLFAKK